MRSAALVVAIGLLAALGAGRRLLHDAQPPVAPLACDDVVEIVEALGPRLACATDAALASCGPIVPGRVYTGCTPGAAVRGPILKLHRSRIDVNRATADDLRALPGVGPRLARAIVEARASGPLCGPDDLRRAEGIGEKRAAELESLVVFTADLCPRLPAK